MLNIKNLSLEHNKIKVLDNINMYIERGTITSIIGKNGSGKSSLVNCINDMEKYKGEITLNINNNEVNIKDLSNLEKSKKLSILPQLLIYPHILVSELIKMGRNPYLKLGQKLSDTDYDIIQKSIDAVNIEPLLDKYIDQLSGGERQKVYLAMMLIQDTELMILDEPTTYLDLNNETEFLNLLNKLKNEFNKTIVIIMHNITNALNYSDNIIILDNGKVCISGKTEEVINSNIIEDIFNVKTIKYNNIYIVI